MAEVKVLIEGYAREEDDAFVASPTTTLIRDGGKTILVDPGANSQKLLDALSKEGLQPQDIDIVFITHYHPDHILNIRLFPGKDIYDGGIIWRDDKEIEYEGKIPDTNVEVIQTPGHADEHCSLLVETDEGKVLVNADVFWWMDDEEQKIDRESLMNKEDDYANNMEKLKESRKKALEIADYIIPGHGKKFKVER